MRTVMVSLLLALAACDAGPIDVDGTCIVALFANDIVYTPIDEFVDSSAVPEEPDFTVTRYDPECRDQGERHRPMNGESNFLPVGTAIYGVAGFGPLEKLTFWDGDWQSWRALIPPASCPAKAEGQVGSLEPPCQG